MPPSTQASVLRPILPSSPSPLLRHPPTQTIYTTPAMHPAFHVISMHLDSKSLHFGLDSNHTPSTSLHPPATLPHPCPHSITPHPPHLTRLSCLPPYPPAILQPYIHTYIDPMSFPYISLPDIVTLSSHTPLLPPAIPSGHPLHPYIKTYIHPLSCPHISLPDITTHSPENPVKLCSSSAFMRPPCNSPQQCSLRPAPTYSHSSSPPPLHPNLHASISRRRCAKYRYLLPH